MSSTLAPLSGRLCIDLQSMIIFANVGTMSASLFYRTSFLFHDAGLFCYSLIIQNFKLIPMLREFPSSWMISLPASTQSVKTCKYWVSVAEIEEMVPERTREDKTTEDRRVIPSTETWKLVPRKELQFQDGHKSKRKSKWKYIHITLTSSEASIMELQGSHLFYWLWRNLPGMLRSGRQLDWSFFPPGKSGRPELGLWKKACL